MPLEGWNTRQFGFRLSVLLIFILTSNNCFFGQSYNLNISKITNEKGEDPGATYAIVKDSIGYIWFGTVDGLYKYDGYTYKVYRNVKGYLNSLGGNTIRALSISRDNKLWIGIQGGGFDCFDLTSEKFTHYYATNKESDGLSGNDIWAILADHRQNIWVGPVGNGLDLLDRSTNTFRHFNVLPKDEIVKDNITIRTLYEDSQGMIWIGMEIYGLSTLDPKSGQIISYRHDAKDPKSIGSNSIYYIFEDSKKQIIACAYGGGMSVFNRNSRSFITYRNIKNNPNSLISDLVFSGIEKRPDEYWIGSDFGLSLLNLNLSTCINYQRENESQNFLSDNRIRVVFRDRNDIVWIGSEAGVDKIIEQKKFRIFKQIPKNNNSIPDGIVRAIFEDHDKNMWFGIIDKGLVRYNPKTNTYVNFIHNPSDPGSISGNKITSIFQDSKGTLWFGDWDNGLNSYNNHTGIFQLVAGTKNTRVKICDTRIQFIKEDRPGILWIGTENGLNRYDVHSQKCSYFIHQENNSNSLSGNSLQSNAFVQDTDGNLWLGTWSEGLNRMKFTDKFQQKAIIKNWKADHSNPDKLNDNNVISLALDQNNLWIGTFGGGLNCMNLISGKFRHFTTENGLPNNIIFAIIVDKEHNLWLSTDKGISKFNPYNESFQNYSKSDGLQNDHFFWGSAFKSSDGIIYFGGINGVNSIDPQHIVRNELVPVPHLVGISVFEKPLSLKIPIGYVDKLDVPYNKNYITFEYAALDFTDPNKNQYMVYMDGLDQDWHPIGNRRQTSYSNLSPGSYVFQLKCSNNDGIWSKKILKVNLIVHPPWWNTWLTRSIIAVLIIGCFLALYLIRVSNLKKQTHKLGVLVKDRTKEIQNQKEEIETFNENLIEQKKELMGTLKELKETQQQLIQSEKMASLGTLIAGVSHEINNPLNYISGGLHLIANLKKQKKNVNTQEYEKQYDEAYNIIATGFESVSNIVQALATFSNRGTPRLLNFYINKIIDNTLLFLSSKISEDITIEKKFEFNGTIPIYASKIHQVMLNLIDNAIFAVNQSDQKNKMIIISNRVNNNYLVIAVTNNGPNIPEHLLNQIFDPFYTTKDPGQGSGLGLSICYTLIKEHSGHIYAQNTKDGVSFIIELPLKN